MYGEYQIIDLPLSAGVVRSKVETFLAENGLRLEAVDRYVGIEDSDERLIAGGGICKDVLKCIAVSEEARSGGLTGKLVARLMQLGEEAGQHDLKVFTKPEYEDIFASLGFGVIAKAGKAILMENGDGLKRYCSDLEKHRRPGRCGAVVMNAAPLTWGHDYLVEKACESVDALFVIPVVEDTPGFSYRDRYQALASAWLEELKVEVCSGSPYAVSKATFPTYFLKDLSDAAETQMTLDLDIFARHIAPALGVTVRFVGTEPSDALTARYNELMKKILPEHGIEVVEVPRLESEGRPVSASEVRKAVAEGSFRRADAIAHPESMPMLVGALASRALRMELDLTPKPGLVDKNGSGAHKDMDYATMSASIDAIVPFIHAMASINPDDDVPADMVELGIKAELKMLAATGGVNTHKGAIFSLGLMATAFAQCYWEGETVGEKALKSKIVALACAVPKSKDTHGAKVCSKFKAKGALQNARDGYPALFKEWLPFYRRVKAEKNGLLKTLLLIVSQLEDTNVLYRKGPAVAEKVRSMAREALKNFSEDKVRNICGRFTSEGISPGGSADMLALTVFADSLLS